MKHAGSIKKRNTQCGTVYRSLIKFWHSSMDLCGNHWMSNVSAVISQVNAQLTKREVMVIAPLRFDGLILHYRFRIFKSKTAAKKACKNLRAWRYYGDK